MNQDHYETLGVDKLATKETIKKAYMRKARKHHPDAGGDKETFAMIATAYDVLSDDDKRAKYDRGESTEPVNEVRQLVVILVQEAFSQQVDGNPLTHIRNKAKAELKTCYTSKEHNIKFAELLKKKRDRLIAANQKSKNTTGLNLMVDVINRSIEEGLKVNEELDDAIQKWNDVIEFVRNIEYPEEQIQAFSRPHGFGRTATWTAF